MKNFSPLAMAALISCGLLTSACEKQADEVVPALQASTASNIALQPGELTPVPVNGVWLTGPAVTGLECNVDMTLVSQKVTPQGEINTWETVGAQKATCAPLEKKVFTTAYRLVISDVTYVIQVKTTSNPDGSVQMLTVWNQNRK